MAKKFHNPTLYAYTFSSKLEKMIYKIDLNWHKSSSLQRALFDSNLIEKASAKVFIFFAQNSKTWKLLNHSDLKILFYCVILSYWTVSDPYWIFKMMEIICSLSKLIDRTIYLDRSTPASATTNLVLFCFDHVKNLREKEIIYCANNWSNSQKTDLNIPLIFNLIYYI